MLTPEQLAMRKTMLTATDLVKLAGVHPLGRGAHDVYTDKVGDAHEEVASETAATIGNRLEPIALGMLAEKIGRVITRGVTERHPILTWLGATPDGNVLAEPGGSRIAVAEAKAVGFRLAHHWTDADDGLPEYVQIQVQAQMIVTRTRAAHVVAIVGTELRTYEVEHDDDLAGALLTLGERFWTRHVLARVAPTPDGSESARKMLLAAWPRHRAELLPADAYAEDWASEYLAAKAAEEEARSRKERAQQLLCARIADAEGIAGKGWKATWKATAPVEVRGFTRAASRTFRFSQVKAKGEAA